MWWIWGCTLFPLYWRITIYMIKKFKNHFFWRSHQVIHTGEKKFSCKTCGKMFGYKTSLLHHIKMHEGDKPFSCPHCPKQFTQNGNLQEHIRIHTGEKPFACSFENCNRRFTTSSQHRNHEKRHRGNFQNEF